MSLKFYLGASGTGKSFNLHKDIVEWAGRDKDKNFLFLVPDQFTMQTQIDLVKASDNNVIMNIDVLSFSRLAHRIFEELGLGNQIVMDDTGKSLILRQISLGMEDSLPVLGKNLNKIGYVHELKSIISEFKQYDINIEKLDKLIMYSQKRGMLKAKLEDIKRLYAAFEEYKRSGFITSEEYISVLTDIAHKSKIIKDSVVILDGFTGFTPVQYRLIEELLKLTDKVIVSVTIDIYEDPYKLKGEQDLFALSRKTIYDLQKISQSVNVKEEEPVLLEEVKRYEDREDLAHLQKAVFRYPSKIYEGESDNIFISEHINPEAEVRQTCINIKKMIMDNGYAYRDIAVVCGDLQSYKDEFVRQGRLYGIPFYIDETRSMVVNPFVEFLRSALNIINDNFSYRSLFHYLRSGLLDVDSKDIDLLDNYVLKCGIKGRKNYLNAFTHLPYKTSVRGEILPENIEALNALNVTREKIISSLMPILKKKGTVSEFIEGIYEFILINDIEKKLKKYSEYFTDMDMPEKAKEYDQVYRKVIDLFDQMHTFLKDEVLSVSEFIKIFDSGIAELDAGTLPGGIDRIIVGDLERSRLGNIKVLMFLGVNDGYIPKANSGGGLLSDLDREFLKGTDIELSPTPREQIFSQRLYLYSIMTKPSQRLYLSYSSSTKEGKALKESYVISLLLRLFPSLKSIKDSRFDNAFEEVMGIGDGMKVLAEALREYAEGNIRALSEEQMISLIRVLKLMGKSDDVERLFEGAFFEYKDNALTASIAKALYGEVLKNSVSRVEKFALCEYAHFLNYGIELYEREEFSFENADLGNVYHSLLEGFAKAVQSRGYSMANYPEELEEEILNQMLTQIGVNYNESVLHSSYSNEYMITRIKSTVRRTVQTIKKQLLCGNFAPFEFERNFEQTIELRNDTKMLLRGKIDRIDVCKKNDKLFVKIVDYKSTARDLELDRLYYGLALQQPVYLGASERLLSERFRDTTIIKAAMQYMQIDNPYVLLEEEDGEEKVEENILKQMRPLGLILEDSEVIESLDRGLSEPQTKSKAIYVDTKKDGSFTKESKLIGKEDLNEVLTFTDNKVRDIANSIIDGHIGINPVSYDGKLSCEYCNYKDICRFDRRLDGFAERKIPKLSKDEALIKIKEANTAANGGKLLIMNK